MSGPRRAHCQPHRGRDVRDSISIRVGLLKSCKDLIARVSCCWWMLFGHLMPEIFKIFNGTKPSAFPYRFRDVTNAHPSSRVRHQYVLLLKEIVHHMASGTWCMTFFQGLWHHERPDCLAVTSPERDVRLGRSLQHVVCADNEAASQTVCCSRQLWRSCVWLQKKVFSLSRRFNPNNSLFTNKCLLVTPSCAH